MDDSFASERAELRASVIDDRRHWRIMAIGRYANGSTDIVACLIRALRNLGHSVLHLDPRVHKSLLSNPLNLKGGMGPIWIETEALEPAIDRFRPQVIIVLAGGMAFRPEEAEALKRRGIVLLGITLSDPDVFDGVVGFAGSSFDIHTTNALGAIARYEEQGVHNTLHFAFGVDRAFAAQHVAIRDRFAADVICLGHATARPERDTVMRAVADRLAGRHSVRGYGRGWTLPDSEVVEGVNVLQASRGGRLHVNFPATRAGFINVKCGVFETVASGGLLATARFDEMALFFDYDTEIIGYDSYEDLVDRVDAVLSEPGRVEAMSRAAFTRLCREHLYEYRWRDLFDRIVALAASPPEWLPASRAAEMQAILSETSPRCRLVMISGYYGAGNVGDELILQSIVSSIETQMPGGQVVVAAQNAPNVEIAHGRGAVARANHAAADGLLAQCDAIVLGGGGLWHDYTFEDAGGLRSLFTGATISIGGFGVLPMIARLRKIPFHVYGMGVGPLENSEAKDLVRFVAEGAEAIGVRDVDSKRILDEILPDGPAVEVAPDVVYGIDLPDAPAPFMSDAISPDRIVIGVNLRFWNRASVSTETLAGQVAGAIRSLAETERRPIAVVALPMQDGAGQDRKALAMLVEHLPPGVQFVELPAPLKAQDLIGALRRIDALVAMRLHACLIAHRLGKRVVGLAYDPKLVAHFQELGRSGYCLALDCGEAALAATLRNAIETPLTEAFQASLTTIEAAAREKLTAFARRVGSAPVRNRIWAIPPAVEAAKPVAVVGGRTVVAVASADDGQTARSPQKTQRTGYTHYLPKPDARGAAPRPISDSYQGLVLGKSEAGRGGKVAPLFDLTGGKWANAQSTRPAPDAGGGEAEQVNGWPREGVAFAYGVDAATEAVQTLAVPSHAALVFTLRRDAPAEGEWSALGFCVPADAAQGVRFSFRLRTPYQRPKNAGLIVLQVMWNGTLLGEMDIAIENEEFESELYAPPAEQHQLLFRLFARKQCREWSWPSAARTTISNFNANAHAWTSPPELRTESRQMAVLDGAAG